MRLLTAALLLLVTGSTYGAGVEDLSFMKGRWAGALGPATLEETWNDPKAGTMVAVVRMSSPEGTVFVELIIISEAFLCAPLARVTRWTTFWNNWNSNVADC